MNYIVKHIKELWYMNHIDHINHNLGALYIS